MNAPSPFRPTAQDSEVTELLDLALDLICVAGLDGYFTRVNQAWTDVLGYSKEELLTQPWINLVHPDDREATIAEAVGLLRDHNVGALVVSADGHVIEGIVSERLTALAVQAD